MKKPKLNICFYNPNTKEETAEYILKIFIAANREKVEKILQDEANHTEED